MHRILYLHMDKSPYWKFRSRIIRLSDRIRFFPCADIYDLVNVHESFTLQNCGHGFSLKEALQEFYQKIFFSLTKKNVI